MLQRFPDSLAEFIGGLLIREGEKGKEKKERGQKRTKGRERRKKGVFSPPTIHMLLSLDGHGHGHAPSVCIPRR